MFAAILFFLGIIYAGILAIGESFSPMAPAGVILGILALFYAVKSFRSPPPSPLSPLLQTGVCVAILYFGIRASISPVTTLALSDLLLILPASCLYLAALHAPTPRESLRLRSSMLGAILLVFFLHLGSGILQLKGQPGYSPGLWLMGAKRVSSVPTGMYGYYGGFANYLFIAGLICLSLACFTYQSRLRRLLLLGLSILAGALVVLSTSRSAALGLFVGLFVWGIFSFFLLIKRQNALSTPIKSLFFFLALGAIPTLFYLVKSVFLSRGTLGIDALSASGVRPQFLSSALEQWLNAPFFGEGSRSFSYQCFLHWSPNIAMGQNGPVFVHNEYLQALTDYGLIGLLCVLFLLGIHLFLGMSKILFYARQASLRELSKEARYSLALCLAGVTGMMGTMTHLLFDFRAHTLPNLLLLIVCCVWTLPLQKPSKHRKNPSTWLTRTTLGLVGLSSLLLGLYILWASLPLISKLHAREDGTLPPSLLQNKVYQTALQRAVKRLPTSWRLNQLALSIHATTSPPQTERIKDLYKTSIATHPYDIIAPANLASLYAMEGKFQQADLLYQSISLRAAPMENFYKILFHWGLMHQKQAILAWKNEDMEQARFHFDQAKKILKDSCEAGRFFSSQFWVVHRAQFLSLYASFLEEQGEDKGVQSLYKEAYQLTNIHNLRKETLLDYAYANYLVKKAKNVWQKRQPEYAAALFIRAKKHLNAYIYQAGDAAILASLQLKKEVDKTLDFFKKTGIEPSTLDSP